MQKQGRKNEHDMVQALNPGSGVMNGPRRSVNINKKNFT